MSGRWSACHGKVAAILGLEAAATEPKVAVVRCNGTCETVRVRRNTMAYVPVPSLMQRMEVRPDVHSVAWDVVTVCLSVSLALYT